MPCNRRAEELNAESAESQRRRREERFEDLELGLRMLLCASLLLCVLCVYLLSCSVELAECETSFLNELWNQYTSVLNQKFVEFVLRFSSLFSSFSPVEEQTESVTTTI